MCQLCRDTKRTQPDRGPMEGPCHRVPEQAWHPPVLPLVLHLGHHDISSPHTPQADPVPALRPWALSLDHWVPPLRVLAPRWILCAACATVPPKKGLSPQGQHCTHRSPSESCLGQFVSFWVALEWGQDISLLLRWIGQNPHQVCSTLWCPLPRWWLPRTLRFGLRMTEVSGCRRTGQLALDTHMSQRQHIGQSTLPAGPSLHNPAWKS